MGKHPGHIHHIGDPGNQVLHLPLLHAVVFQGKGHILRHGQADELAVGILQDGAHHFGKVKQAQLARVPAANGEPARSLARVGIGNQAVHAVGQGGLSTAGGSGNQDLLPPGDGQIDVVQRGLGLGGILKAEIFKGNQGFQGWASFRVL